MKKAPIMPTLLIAAICALASMAGPSPTYADAIGAVVMYVPNRVFDLMDIFRVRLRVGPGISAGVRATRPLSAYLGLHSTVFAGLPGPRGAREIPWPVGFDLRSGAQASVADVSKGAPYYDPLEVGLEVQPLIVGVNVGIGVFEILDFAAGLLCIDLQHDDFGRDYAQQESADSTQGQGAPADGGQTRTD